MRQFWRYFMLIIFAAGMAQAATGNHAARLGPVNDYLNSIQTLVADFTQVAPDGSIGNGRFFLKRPGKFRWQYDPPIPLLIVGNGNNLAYHDLELDQVSHVAAKDNLAGILAKPKVDLARDLTVREVVERAGTIRITVEDPKHQAEGSLTLVFTTAPVTLQQLEVLDGAGQMTRISLNNLTYGGALDNKLFTIDTTERNLRRIQR